MTNGELEAVDPTPDEVEPTRLLSVRVPVDLHDRLNSHAKSAGYVSVSELVRYLLRRELGEAF